MLLFNVSFTSFLAFLPYTHIPFHGIHILILTYNLIQIVIKIIVKRLLAVHPNPINFNYLSAIIVITNFWQFFNLFEISISVVRYIEFFPFFFIAYFYRAFFGFFPIFNPSSPPLHKHLLQTAFFEFF